VCAGGLLVQRRTAGGLLDQRRMAGGLLDRLGALRAGRRPAAEPAI